MIFKREISRNLKSLIIWSIVIGGLVLLMLSIYPQFNMNNESMNELLNAYPESLKKAFGMDKLDMSSILGFYGIEIYMMTTLFGSIFASMLASNIISKEENEKTVEFLLSKPVTRTQIITEKFLAMSANILIFNGIIAIISILGFQFAKNEQLSMKTFSLLVIATILLHFTFATISFFLSTIIKKSRNILATSLGLVFLCYFLGVISGISDKFKNLKYLSPFKYVDAGDILVNNAIEPLYIIIMVSVMVISIALTYAVYRKKDISV
jgi:ABC-2 type transport system permease protein